MLIYDKRNLRRFYFDVAKCLCRTFHITSFYEKNTHTWRLIDPSKKKNNNNKWESMSFGDVFSGLFSILEELKKIFMSYLIIVIFVTDLLLLNEKILGACHLKQPKSSPAYSFVNNTSPQIKDIV